MEIIKSMKKTMGKSTVFIWVMIIMLTASSICANEAKAAVTLDSLMAQYVGTTWDGSYQGAIQCKGFAAMIWNKLYGIKYIGAYDAQKYYIPNVSGGYEIGRLNFNQMSQSAATSLLKRGQAGDFIQVRRRGKTYGHSMIYVSQDSTGIVAFDCNSDGRNGVKKYHITWSSFYSKNSAMSMYRAYNANVNPNTNTIVPTIKYSIDNVKITYIDSDKITVAWSTTNLPRVCMVVTAGDQSWKTPYATGSSFSATFNRSSIPNCPSIVQILLYGYSNISGAGENETVHRVTYNASAGYVAFPVREDKSWSESVPNKMLSSGNFRGWVISDTSPISSVEVAINGTILKASLFTRDDVSSAYPDYKYVKGYNLDITPYFVKDGSNIYSVKAILANGKSITVTSGSFTASKVECLFDPVFFKARYSEIPAVKKLTSDKQLEQYFYEHMNTKVDGEYLVPSMVFNPTYYVNSNYDLKEQGWKSAMEIYDHFIKYCMKAGKGEFRATSPWCSLYYMHNTYGDLKDMSAEKLLNWAATYGLKLDQRLLAPTNQARAFRKFYQISEYAALNPDLIQTYGQPAMLSDFSKTGAQKYWNHLFTYGINENRRTSKSFNIAVYRKNAELDSQASAWTVLQHYCNVGYSKGIKTK